MLKFGSWKIPNDFNSKIPKFENAQFKNILKWRISELTLISKFGNSEFGNILNFWINFDSEIPKFGNSNSKIFWILESMN